MVEQIVAFLDENIHQVPIQLGEIQRVVERRGRCRERCGNGGRRRFLLFRNLFFGKVFDRQRIAGFDGFVGSCRHGIHHFLHPCLHCRLLRHDVARGLDGIDDCFRCFDCFRIGSRGTGFDRLGFHGSACVLFDLHRFDGRFEFHFVDGGLFEDGLLEDKSGLIKSRLFERRLFRGALLESVLFESKLLHSEPLNRNVFRRAWLFGRRRFLEHGLFFLHA
ncbi:MAG TPA: hypothetical protein VFH12_05615, partial [Pseudoxanthomonas sp.]|nr:hypothetical protein [Pseudoxanthomonas sp.]